ncbi:MAG: hypothetical protein ACTS4X_01190 [Candidatus Hodgkinia cicadicola]
MLFGSFRLMRKAVQRPKGLTEYRFCFRFARLVRRFGAAMTKWEMVNGRSTANKSERKFTLSARLAKRKTPTGRKLHYQAAGW